MGAANPNPAVYTITTPTIELLPPDAVSGFHFVGWFDSISDGNQITSIPQGSIGELTLYARWDEAEYYTITFCGNDRCYPKACHIPSPITVQDEQTVMLPAAIPQRKAYRFIEWNTDSCGKGTSYLPGEMIPALHSDLCLFAIWQRNLCICKKKHKSTIGHH